MSISGEFAGAIKGCTNRDAPRYGVASTVTPTRFAGTRSVGEGTIYRVLGQLTDVRILVHSLFDAERGKFTNSMAGLTMTI